MDGRAWRRFKRNRGAFIGILLVGIVGCTAALGPLLAPHDPNYQFRKKGLDSHGVPTKPNQQFWLGGDTIGRDELSRLLHGGSVSIKVAFFATALATLIGLFFGVSAGYFGGLFDIFAMRFVDILLSLPFLIIAIAIRRVIDEVELWTLYVLLGLLSWSTLARIVRTKTQQLRDSEFVQAARALGMSHARILAKHVLPNVMGPAIVVGTTMIANMIIVESAMSFLGLGVEPPQASWGSMLHDAQPMLVHAPRLILFPGLMIVASVFGFNLLGEGLRDALDPKA